MDLNKRQATDLCDADYLTPVPAEGKGHFVEEKEGVETWPGYLMTQKPEKGDDSLQEKVLEKIALKMRWIDFLESSCRHLFSSTIIFVIMDTHNKYVLHLCKDNSVSSIQCLNFTHTHLCT